MKKILLFSLMLTLLGISRGWSQVDDVERIDVKTPATVSNGKYQFTSSSTSYTSQRCNKLRFTLTESAAFYQNKKNRFSLDYFELRDASGAKVNLTADCFSGNYGKDYAKMLDGVNGIFCNGVWGSADEGHDYFDIKIPGGVDLGGAFSFYFVTENTTMNVKAFGIDVMYVERYAINVNSPGGFPVSVVYDGTVINPANGIEVGFDANKFSVSDIGGYTWSCSVDDEAKTVTFTYTEIPELVNTVVKSVSAEPVSTLEEGVWYILVSDLDGTSYVYDDGAKLRRAGANAEIAVGTPISRCGSALFTLSDKKEPVTVSGVELTGYKMKWGTNRYTKWPIYHNEDVLSSTELPDDAHCWVYASSVEYENANCFKFSKNTNTQFSNSGADVVNGKNIFLYSGGPNAVLKDWSRLEYTISTISEEGGKKGGNVWKVYKVELETRLADVTISVKNGNEAAQHTENIKLPVGALITLKEHVPSFSFVSYGDEAEEVKESGNDFILTYQVDEEAERAFPFATSVDDLDNKWFSMFTLNGRMHVYDDTSLGKIFYYDPASGEYKSDESEKKYPTIDKATFTRLNNGFFWGFVRASRFSPTYIYNKGAGKDLTLYLTEDADDQPLLFKDERGNVSQTWVTNGWAVQAGQTVDEDGTPVQYYGIVASGTEEYISNYDNKGYITTSSVFDNGSTVKLTPELNTYNILKDRALAAPCNAVHSLDAASRKLITDIPEEEQNVERYGQVIDNINKVDNETGFIEFVDGAYYYLRNYTPADETGVYVLASEDGNDLGTFTVPSEQAGTEDVAMTYSNINAIWKIKEADISYGPVPGTGIGASRTIARKVTHANSNNQLGAVNSTTLAEEGANYYFVELGAGQHFMKNLQYLGSGQQAKAKPLSCSPEGAVKEGDAIHKKNTRDAWYGIQVKNIQVEIGSAGYATIHLPFGVTLPTDNTLTAYAITATGVDRATLTKVESIPANEGVILKGAPGKYTLTLAEVEAWAEDYNKLEGSNMHEDIDVEAYVLSMPEGKEVGLYKAQMSGGKWLNNDNKAYLPVSAVPDAAGARFLSFDFGTETGIDVISGTEPVSAESVVYDLSGRRVRSAQKGMYIVNGQKVVK